MIRYPTLFLTAVLLAATASIDPLSAQQIEAAAQQKASVKQPTRVPVTVVLVEGASADKPFTILRRADLAPRDVILLRADDADGKQLSAAVSDLLTMRELLGDTASADATGQLRLPSEGLSPDQARKALPWAQRVVNDVRKAEPQFIAGVGLVPAVEIWLPAKGKGKTKKPKAKP